MEALRLLNFLRERLGDKELLDTIADVIDEKVVLYDLLIDIFNCEFEVVFEDDEYDNL